MAEWIKAPENLRLGKCVVCNKEQVWDSTMGCAPTKGCASISSSRFGVYVDIPTCMSESVNTGNKTLIHIDCIQNLSELEKYIAVLSDPKQICLFTTPSTELELLAKYSKELAPLNKFLVKKF